MATTFTKAAVGALASVIPGVVTTGLRNLANSTCRLGSVVTPTAAAPELEVSYRLESVFVAGSITVGLVIAKAWWALDVGNSGTYDDMISLDAGTTPPGVAPDFIFVAEKAVNNAKLYTQSNPKVLARPAGVHKILLQNTSGFAFANTNDTDSLLKESTNNELGT